MDKTLLMGQSLLAKKKTGGNMEIQENFRGKGISRMRKRQAS